jgi:hypothetical protein
MVLLVKYSARLLNRNDAAEVGGGDRQGKSLRRLIRLYSRVQIIH